MLVLLREAEGEVEDGRGWNIKQWGIVVGVSRVVAIRESSDEDLGVRERGSAVIVVVRSRREDIHGMLAKKAWDGEGLGGIIGMADRTQLSDVGQSSRMESLRSLDFRFWLVSMVVRSSSLLHSGWRQDPVCFFFSKSVVCLW